MNYSATDAYHQKCDQFDKKQINPRKVKRRWFRNFYVHYVNYGYFDHFTEVLQEDAIREGREEIVGRLYGPFTSKQANAFAVDLRDTHLNFVMGGD